MIEAEGLQPDATLLPKRPGERLREARLAQDLDLSDVAQRTRIPQRHLEAIETANYGNLPSSTYAMGFAKAYARAVGLDEVAVAADVRAELSNDWNRPTPSPVYEPEDASRVPSRGLVWSGILVAVLLLAGIGLWYGTDLFRGGGSAPVTADATGEVVVPIPDPSPAVAMPTSAAGQVRITATDEVWVRVYDAADTTLLMKTMAPGESYDVPASADRPMINVGRSDKLSVTVNGSAVPPLGDGRLAIKDVPISAEALLARGATGGAGVAPTPGATSVSPAPAASGNATTLP